MESRMIPDFVWALIFPLFLPTGVESSWDSWGYCTHAYLQPELHPLQSLVSLCLVSRQFCRIAQPLLYRIVNVQYLQDVQVFCFLRTLLTAPHLAQMIRVLSINDGVYPLPGMKPLLEAALRHVQTPPRFKTCLEHTIQENRRGWIGGIGSIALSLTPNVRRVGVTMQRRPENLTWLLSGSLKMEEDFHYETNNPTTEDYLKVHKVENEGLSFSAVTSAREPSVHEIESMGVQAYANYGLKQMKEVWIVADVSDREATSMAQFEAVLLHPSLEILHLVKVDWRKDEVEKMKWTDQMSNLHTLDIRESLVDHVGLLDILTRCPELRRLSIYLGNSDLEGFYGYGEDDEEGWYFDMVEFGHVLRSHGKNLTELRLNTIDYRCDHRFEERNTQTAVIGSLKELKSLRVLEIHELDLIFPVDHNMSSVPPPPLGLNGIFPMDYNMPLVPPTPLGLNSIFPVDCNMPLVPPPPPPLGLNSIFLVGHNVSLVPPPPLGLNGILPENLEVIHFPQNDSGAFCEMCDIIEMECYPKLRKVRLGGYLTMQFQSPSDRILPGWNYSFKCEYVGETYSWKGKQYTFIEFTKMG